MIVCFKFGFRGDRPIMLTIVKTIKLLDDFHFDAFRNHVKNLSIRSYYPLALVDSIDRKLEADQSTDYLCKAVYTSIDEKSRKKFYQLAHYTFGLTAFLAKNYPDYLQHNISRFQRLINQGDFAKANRLAELLLELSEKIEDFSTQAKILNILGQQSILMESSRQAAVSLQKARIALQHQLTISRLFEHFYNTYHLKEKPGQVDIENNLDFFKKHFDHPSIIVQVSSKCCYCFFLHFHKDDRFFEKETYLLLENIEDQLEKNNYLVFPYLVYFSDRVRFFKLRYQLKALNIKEVLEKSQELWRSDKDILYWNSYINQPEMFMINAEANFYISNYMKAYRDDHQDLMPEDIRERIEQLKQDCKAILDNQQIEQNFTIRYINVTTIYCLLLLVDGKKEALKNAVAILNQILITYQQISFQAYVDAIYTIMGTAYFCLKNYENVEQNYLRYRKATNKKVTNPVNDMTIHGFYYAAKWISTGREQYARKLKKLIDSAQKDRFSNIRQTLEELCNYYKIPTFL